MAKKQRRQRSPDDLLFAKPILVAPRTMPITSAYLVHKSDVAPLGRILVHSRKSSRREYHFFWPELDERELYAIGFLTVQWAHLEHLIYAHCLRLTGKQPLDPNATKLSFKLRRNAWLQLIRKRTRGASLRRWLIVHERIVVAERDRHKVTHGLWRMPELRRMAENTDEMMLSSFRPPFVYDKHFDVGKVLRLGEDIGAISLCFHFPNGPMSMKRPYHT